MIRKKFSQRYERKLFATKETLINLQASNILENKPKTNKTPRLYIKWYKTGWGEGVTGSEMTLKNTHGFILGQ